MSEEVSRKVYKPDEEKTRPMRRIKRVYPLEFLEKQGDYCRVKSLVESELESCNSSMSNTLVIDDIDENGISRRKFSGNLGFKNLVIRNNVTPTTIGEGAFMSCFNLENVSIYNGINKIEASCFEQCVKLNKIVLPEDGLKEIGPMAFKQCWELEEIVIPNSVTNIGHYIFLCCDKNLKRIIIPKHLIEKYGEKYIRCGTNADVIPNNGTINV